jgi:DNA polymerase-4
VTAEKLHERGVFVVRDVAELESNALVALLGRASGLHLHALAHNRDPRPVLVGQRRRSIGSQRAMGHRRLAMTEIDAVLVGIVDRVTRRLRSAERLCRTVVLRLRFDDFARITRSHSLPEPSDDTTAILATARGLVELAAPLLRDRGCTLVGLSLANLYEAHDPVQVELPLGVREPGRLDRALDGVKDKYGGAAITRAVLLGRDPGWTIPMLPD